MIQETTSCEPSAMLHAIHSSPGITFGDLWRQMGRRQGMTTLAASRIRDQLIQEGLVEKKIYAHYLTPCGEQQVAQQISPEAANDAETKRTATA